MYVVTRRVCEGILIGSDTKLVVLSTRGRTVKLGIKTADGTLLTRIDQQCKPKKLAL